jgi:hypothetical protein
MFENKNENAPVVETPVVEAVVEAPVLEEPKVEIPVVEAPVVETPKVEEPVSKFEDNSAEDIAIYTLRSLTLPGGSTIPKGYSFVSKKRYEKIANHKAVRIANKDEIKTYLK